MRQTTKHVIAETLGELLDEQTLDEITVKKIMEKCNINRQTFYYHFYDIYDLLEWYLGESIESYLRSKPLPPNDWKEQERHIFRFFYENRRKVLHAYDQSHRKSYERFITKMITPIVKRHIDAKKETQNVPEDKRKFLVKVYVWMSMSLFFEWLEGGMPDEKVANLEDYFILSDASIGAALKAFECSNTSGNEMIQDKTSE